MQTPEIGIGGAPTRASTFPEDAKGRKAHPVVSGVLDYFPDAIVAIAHVSFTGNEQHNAGQPLHWARGKSSDEADALLRHLLQRGSNDSDGLRHSAKMAWRALALLQKEIEKEQESELKQVTQDYLDKSFKEALEVISPSPKFERLADPILPAAQQDTHRIIARDGHLVAVPKTGSSYKKDESLGKCDCDDRRVPCQKNVLPKHTECKFDPMDACPITRDLHPE